MASELCSATEELTLSSHLDQTGSDCSSTEVKPAKYYHGHGYGDCPNMTCAMCCQVGHASLLCPWHDEGVPPGTEEKPNLTIFCKCCDDRVHYLQSILDGENVTGYAIFKDCAHCMVYKDHVAAVCSSVVERLLCRDASFDPCKHSSFYVENLPTWFTELDLLRHFRHFEEIEDEIDDVVVHHNNETGTHLGYVKFSDANVAFSAFSWGNGHGAQIDTHHKIKCHPSKGRT